MPVNMMPRGAELADLDALVELERICFRDLMLTRESLRRFLTGDTADVLALGPTGTPWGHGVVLYRKGTTIARLHSLAVDPGHRRQGLGRRLLDASEQAARERGMARLRLIVRLDDPAAMALYHGAGYQIIQERPHRMIERMGDSALMDKAL